MKAELVKTSIGEMFTTFRKGVKTLVFLSGIGHFPTFDNFSQIIKNLPEDCGYLTIDYPNFGESPIQNQAGMKISDFIHSLQQILIHYKISDYLICAHSISGIIAVKLSQLYKPDLCEGLFLIEPTTHSILFGKLAREPYPEMLEMRKKIQQYGDEVSYFKSLTSGFMDKAESETLWQKFEKSAARAENENETFKPYCDVQESDFSLKQSPNAISTFIFTQAHSQQEYLDSEFYNENTEIILGEDNHYLHWTEANSILEQLRSFFAD